MKKKKETIANRTTIVGGRPGDGYKLKGIPRGIEILIKKASVDKSFEKKLIKFRSKAAKELELDLTETEKQIIDTIPVNMLKNAIKNINIPDSQKSQFKGKVAAAMLSAISAFTLINNSPSAKSQDISQAITRGIRPDFIETHPLPPTGIRPDEIEKYFPAPSEKFLNSLNKPVNLKLKDIYLEVLLETLSKYSGKKIVAEEKLIKAFKFIKFDVEFINKPIKTVLETIFINPMFESSKDGIIIKTNFRYITFEKGNANAAYLILKLQQDLNIKVLLDSKAMKLIKNKTVNIQTEVQEISGIFIKIFGNRFKFKYNKNSKILRVTTKK